MAVTKIHINVTVIVVPEVAYRAEKIVELLKKEIVPGFFTRQKHGQKVYQSKIIEAV